MARTCPECSARNAVNAGFCSKCGSSLTADGAQVSQPPPTTPPPAPPSPPVQQVASSPRPAQSSARRRVALIALWLSIFAVFFALWLWQDKRSEADNNASVDRIVGAATRTSSQSEDPDYTVPFIIGAAGVVGVVVAGSQLKRQ